MAIGKSAMILICFMIAAVSIVSIFSIAQNDKSTDAYYTAANHTANATSEMGQAIASSTTGMMVPLVLVVSILFLFSVLLIFKKK
jgi:hypothetical protein